MLCMMYQYACAYFKGQKSVFLPLKFQTLRLLMVSLGIFTGSPVLKSTIFEHLTLIFHWKQLKRCTKQHFYGVITDSLLNWKPHMSNHVKIKCQN